MIRRWMMRGAAALAIACVLAPVGVAAQTTTGSIRGTVVSSQGPVVGASVAARNVATNATRTALTSENGFYFMGGLRPGRYELTVQMLGFGEQTRAVQVQIGQTLDVNFNLEQQALELEGIEVTATRVQETRTSEVATNVTREQIETLPSRDRNFLELAQLAPGVRAVVPDNGIRKTFSAGSQSPEQVNVFIDGASYKNDVLLGGVAGQDASQGNPFPQNAVQEFRIVTQNYKAEYQKAASAIITATTQSGSNDWAFDLFAYNVCKGCVQADARVAFVSDSLGEDAPKNDFRRWQLGGSVGGPLIRDRLFFFASYENNLRDEPSVVTPGGGDPPPGLNPQAFAGTFKTEFREHLGFAKLTYTPSAENTFDLSFNLRTEEDLRGFGTAFGAPTTSRESAENVSNDVYTGVGNWKWASGTWLNEAQVSFQRYQWNPAPLDMNTPGRNFFGLIRVGGRDSRQEFTQDRISLRNDISYSGFTAGGDHVFKAGVNVDFLNYRAIKHFNANPVFNFRSEEDYAFPFEALIGFGDPEVDSDNTQFGVYIQDDWSVSDRLVLNLGLRWDVETNMINNDFETPQPIVDSLTGPLRDRLLPLVDSELGGLDEYITNGDDRDVYLGAFQPRLGFSWDVMGDQRTTVFGGFGVYYDRNVWNFVLDEFFRRQFKVVRVCFGPEPRGDCPTPTPFEERFFDRDQLIQLAESGTSGAPEVFMVRNDTKPPKSYQYSAGVRQSVGPLLVTLSYAGSRGYNGFAYIRGTACCNQLLPTYSNLLLADPRVENRYNSLQLKVEKPLVQGARWGGALAYTLGKAEQKGDYFFALDDRYPTIEDFPWRPARGTSGPADERHTLVLNAAVRLPWELLLSTVMNFGSGVVQYGTDCSQGCGPDNRRDYVFEPPRHNFLGIPDVFHRRNIDLRAEKALTLTTGQQVGVFVDLFNALNQANWGCYDTFIRPLPEGPNPNLGKPLCAADGRRIQIGLRYGFRQGG